MILLVPLLCTAANWTALGQHRHINAGVFSRSPGSPLSFVNGASFDAASGFLIRLNPTNHPALGPVYKGGDDVTFTSLPATLDYGGPDSHAALPGTHVRMILVSLEGPIGGILSFWDSFDGFFDATEITFSLACGSINSTNGFALSENDGAAGADPYGHIHGRKFSVNRPGLYTAGFKLVDDSINGTNGGPVHASSETVKFNFQAGTTIASLEHSQTGDLLKFGTESARNYYIEKSSSLGANAAWTKAAGPITGTGRLENASVPSPNESTVFYRLRVE